MSLSISRSSRSLKKAASCRVIEADVVCIPDGCTLMQHFDSKIERQTSFKRCLLLLLLNLLLMQASVAAAAPEPDARDVKEVQLESYSQLQWLGCWLDMVDVMIVHHGHLLSIPPMLILFVFNNALRAKHWHMVLPFSGA